MEYTSSSYFVSKIIVWASKSGRSFPWRLNPTPYRVCVAEILLQQTTASRVAEVYEAFIKQYPDVEKLSRAKITKIRSIIGCLGLTYRAEILKRMAKQVVREYKGVFPRERKQILKLYGVGEYVTSAILCFAYNEKIIVLDTNTIRLYSRFFGFPVRLPSSKPVKRISEIANSIVIKQDSKLFNYAALDFSAVVCKHYNPSCSVCPVNFECKHNLSIC